MNQSNAIFFFVFAAFFVFITLRGELPKYMGFLLASPAKGTTQVGGNTFLADRLGQVSGGGNLSSWVPTRSEIENNNSIGKTVGDFAKIAALF